MSNVAFIRTRTRAGGWGRWASQAQAQGSDSGSEARARAPSAASSGRRLHAPRERPVPRWRLARRPLAAGVENDGRGSVTRFVGEPEPALTSDLSCHTSLWENSQRHAAPALMPPRFSSYARLPPIHIPATASRQRPARRRPPAAASAAQHPAEGVLLGHVAISDHLHFLHVPPPLRAPIRSSPISSARENVIQGRRSLRVHATRDATRRVSLRVYACTLWDPPAA